MKRPLKSRKEAKLILWRAWSSMLGTTERRRRENISARFAVQEITATCWTVEDWLRTLLIRLWLSWQMTSRGAEWRAIQIFQTYFSGAKFPMEAVQSKTGKNFDKTQFFSVHRVFFVCLSVYLAVFSVCLVFLS